MRWYIVFAVLQSWGEWFWGEGSTEASRLRPEVEIPVQAHQWWHTAALQEDTSYKVSKSTGSFLLQNPVNWNRVLWQKVLLPCWEIILCRQLPATLYYWYILASKVHHRSAVSSQSLNMQIDCLDPQTYSSRLSWSSNLFGCVISLHKLRNHSFSSSNLFSYVIPVPKLGFESFLGQNNTI